MKLEIFEEKVIKFLGFEKYVQRLESMKQTLHTCVAKQRNHLRKRIRVAEQLIETKEKVTNA